MGRVNQLFQDECERKIAEYLAGHPDCNEADAHDALFGNEPDEPSQ